MTSRKTIGYIRVSTDKQAGKGLSLNMQETGIRKYCDYHELDLHEIIRDEGLSGKTVKQRPGMSRLWSAIESGEANAIVVWKFDRAFRSVRDALNFMDSLKKVGCEFHSVQEKLDTSNAIGNFAMQMMMVVAELEARQTGERTSAALRDKKEKKGRQINGYAPYGLCWHRGELAFEKKEMKLVCLVLRAHEQGRRECNITQLINNLDAYKTRNGSPAGRTQVQSIIANYQNGKYPDGWRLL